MFLGETLLLPFVQPSSFLLFEITVLTTLLVLVLSLLTVRHGVSFVGIIARQKSSGDHNLQQQKKKNKKENKNIMASMDSPSGGGSRWARLGNFSFSSIKEATGRITEKVTEKVTSVAESVTHFVNPAEDRLFEAFQRLKHTLQEARKANSRELTLAPSTEKDARSVLELVEEEQRRRKTRDSAQQPVYNRLINLSGVKFLCVAAERDIPLGTANVFLDVVSGIIRCNPERFFAEASQVAPVLNILNWGIAADRSATVDTAVWARFLNALANVVAASPIVLSERFIVEMEPGKLSFPLFSAAVSLLFKNEDATEAVVKCCAVPDMRAAMFIMQETSFCPQLWTEFEAAFAQMKADGFVLSVTRRQEHVSLFFYMVSFLSRVMETAHESIANTLAEGLEGVLLEGIFTRDALLSPDGESVAGGDADREMKYALITSATVFLRELFDSLIVDSAFSVVLTDLLLREDHISFLLQRLSSKNDKVALATLQLFFAVLSRHDKGIYWRLVGQYFENAAYLKDNDVSISLEKLPLEWREKFVALAGATDSVGDYLTDASSMVSDNYGRYGALEAVRVYDDAGASANGGAQFLFRPLQSSETISVGSDDSLHPDFPGPFLRTVLQRMRRFLSNKVEANILLSGILCELLTVPQPNLQLFLLAPNLPLRQQVDSLGHVVDAVVADIKKSERFETLNQMLPTVMRTMRIQSDLLEAASPTDRTEPDANMEFEMCVAVFLEFRKEIEAVLRALYNLTFGDPMVSAT